MWPSITATFVSPNPVIFSIVREIPPARFIPESLHGGFPPSSGFMASPFSPGPRSTASLFYFFYVPQKIGKIRLPEDPKLYRHLAFSSFPVLLLSFRVGFDGRQFRPGPNLLVGMNRPRRFFFFSSSESLCYLFPIFPRRDLPAAEIDSHLILRSTSRVLLKWIKEQEPYLASWRFLRNIGPPTVMQACERETL